MRNLRLVALTSIAFLLASNLALAQQAQGQAQGQAAGLAQSLQQKAQQVGMACYTRQMANGVRRVYLNPSGMGQLQAMEQVLHRNSNVLEICHIGTSQAYHTMGIFNRQMMHVQFKTGTNNWRLRSWGYGLRPSESPLYSAMIQLTPSEARRLQEQFDGGSRAQGDEAQAGAQWENGNLQRHSPRTFNCVSYYSEMPIGDNGEPLWRLLGLPHSHSGDPRGLMNALERSSNDRVVGICVYGPTLPNFSATQQNDKFTFQP